MRNIKNIKEKKYKFLKVNKKLIIIIIIIII